jgi:hypothetical protein
MAPGAAVLLDRASPRTARWAALGGGLLVGWNLLLLGVYRHWIGGLPDGELAAVFTRAERYIIRRPLEALGMLAAASWLTYTLVAAFGDDRGRAAARVAPDRIPHRQAA